MIRDPGGATLLCGKRPEHGLGCATSVTFVLLIYQVAAYGALSPEEEERAGERHRELQAASSRRGQLHAVARLDSDRHASTVRLHHGGGHEVSDGPFVESKEWLVGFYLMDCNDEAQAVQRAKQICTSPHHAIEVRRVSWRWEE